MYGGTIPLSKDIIEKMYSSFRINIGNLKNNIDKNKSLFTSYNVEKKGKSELFPCFNNGLYLIKEELAEKFYNKIITIIQALSR